MASLRNFVCASLRRMLAPEDPSASSSAAATRSPFRCNPESGVGLLAAVAEPASSYLRVAKKPVRTGIRGIMSVTDDLCCNGACGSVHCRSRLELGASTSGANKTCSLCSSCLHAARVYTYMDLMFCTRECRFDYFMEELYDKRYRETIGMPPSNGIRADIKALLVPWEEEMRFREIFFS